MGCRAALAMTRRFLAKYTNFNGSVLNGAGARWPTSVPQPRKEKRPIQAKDVHKRAVGMPSKPVKNQFSRGWHGPIPGRRGPPSNTSPPRWVDVGNDGPRRRVHRRSNGRQHRQQHKEQAEKSGPSPRSMPVWLLAGPGKNWHSAPGQRSSCRQATCDAQCVWQGSSEAAPPVCLRNVRKPQPTVPCEPMATAPSTMGYAKDADAG